MSAGRRDSLFTGLFTPPFVLAVVLLGASALLAGPFARSLKFKQAKLPIALRAPLSALRVDALSPYRVVDRTILTPEVVDALGTDRYVSWLLEDTSLSNDDPLRLVSLFVTYYSGGRDLVPHTPDVCYLGSGYEPAQGHENLTVEVASLKPTFASVPVRVCTFVQTAVFDRRKRTVVYTFHCNGRFTATRNGVRVSINNPRNTYAYFSKVEISFPKATRTESVEGAAKIFDRVLPVLMEDHWPDFEAAEARAREAADAG
ncbi:MAG: exosortase-associated EpsI family protein [Phycisphaerales bacterium]|nr:MAG: exosortase-associated EpsI family protein [Phycisphaerales bacterium]